MPIDLKLVANSIVKLRKLLKKKHYLLQADRVHKLRARIRRFEVSAEALALAESPEGRRALDYLKPIRKAAGKVRDMDVLTSYLLKLPPSIDAGCAVPLAEYLGAERHRLAKKLRRQIARKGKRTRKALKMCMRQVADLGRNGRPQRSAAAKAQQLSLSLASPAMLNRGNLHAYRLKVKQLRYLLQSADTAAHPQLVGALGKTKDAIGEWHDWEELMAIATRTLDDRVHGQVVAELRKRGRDKYELALETAKKMRARFVGSAKGPKDGSKISGAALGGVQAMVR